MPKLHINITKNSKFTKADIAAMRTICMNHERYLAAPNRTVIVRCHSKGVVRGFTVSSTPEDLDLMLIRLRMDFPESDYIGATTMISMTGRKNFDRSGYDLHEKYVGVPSMFKHNPDEETTGFAEHNLNL